MRAYVKKNNISTFLLTASLLCLLIFGGIMYGNTISINRVRHQVGDDERVTYSVYPRGGSTDTWIKTSTSGYRTRGKIFEIAVSNYSNYLVNDWQVRIDIVQDCWINNAWNGNLEIHQNVYKQEMVQTLDLRNIKKKDEILLEHFYDTGDLMINLYEGDYIIYHPNKELYEDPVLSKNGHSTIGFIFYTPYGDTNEISPDQTMMTYYYKRELENEPIFAVFILACILWTILLTLSLCNQINMHKIREMQSQIALEEALEEARRANDAKSIFLATVSHEIRTPINAMLGMNTMILRESKQEEIRRFAKDIDSSGQTLLSLVNDILDLSKIESGKMEIIPVEYSLSEVVKNVINMVKPKAIEKNLDLFIDIDKNIPSKLCGDEVRIKQVILNILNNAVKYTKKGSVLLKAGVEFVNDEKIILKVSVRDTGIGIKKEDQVKLFSRYERIEEEKNRNIEGTGLGLNITNKLLSLMGATLEVESEYGKGSEFSFDLVQKVVDFEPIGKLSLENISDVYDEDKEIYHAPKANILVIDDVKMNLVVIKNLLKRVQCQVDICESGNEGIALAKDKHYDIIFIDHMMPNLDGIDTLHLMNKECELNRETPKIVLTANANVGAKEEYLRDGYDDYLSKPVDPKLLETLVMKYIPSTKLEAVNDFLPEKITKYQDIADLDISQGIKHSGSEAVYEKILKIFAESSIEEDAHIREYADNLDYDNYIVEAHGIKSSAKTIGAKKLASIALEMEIAGKHKDSKKILEETSILIEEHRRLAREIENIG